MAVLVPIFDTEHTEPLLSWATRLAAAENSSLTVLWSSLAHTGPDTARQNAPTDLLPKVDATASRFPELTVHNPHPSGGGSPQRRHPGHTAVTS